MIDFERFKHIQIHQNTGRWSHTHNLNIIVYINIESFTISPSPQSTWWWYSHRSSSCYCAPLAHSWPTHGSAQRTLGRSISRGSQRRLCELFQGHRMRGVVVRLGAGRSCECNFIYNIYIVTKFDYKRLINTVKRERENSIT